MTFRAIVSTAALLLASWQAPALELRPFSEDALAQAQARNHAVAVHFHANWCPTCRAQTKVLESFVPDRTLDITVLVADYDNTQALKQRMGVRAQSTLIVFRGTRETARLVGDTAPSALRAALETGLR